tara:strand:+ start:1283 stop:1675 length:393 start_codon:yes stop_codon:yes gene_type:complete
MENYNHSNKEDAAEQHVEEYEYEDDQELDTDEVAAAAYNRVDALIELMVRKGLITEEELDAIEEELLEEDEDEYLEGEEEEEDDQGPAPHSEPGPSPGPGPSSPSPSPFGNPSPSPGPSDNQNDKPSFGY